MEKKLHLKVTLEVFGDEYFKVEQLYANTNAQTVLTIEDKLSNINLQLNAEQRRKLGIRA